MKPAEMKLSDRRNYAHWMDFWTGLGFETIKLPDYHIASYRLKNGRTIKIRQNGNVLMMSSNSYDGTLLGHIDPDTTLEVAGKYLTDLLDNPIIRS